MLKFIDADDDLKKSMRGAKNSRDLFISAFKEKLMEKQETLQLFSLKCTNGHKMDHCIERLAFTMFNIRAKNYVSERNDELHKNAKRKSATKRDSSSMKISKLQSAKK